MTKSRIIFLGTSDFAVTCLKGILACSQLEIAKVITQPDRQAGRKMKLQSTPIKSFCLENDVPVMTVENVNDEKIIDLVGTWNVTGGVVVAFGQILSPQFIGLFNGKLVNVHASLLPRWRGAAPIQRAIEAGDKQSGVSLQAVVEKLDAGPLIGSRAIEIGKDLDATMLHDQLARLGAEMLAHEFVGFLQGKIVPQEQGAGVTYAKKIKKEEAQIDFNLPAESIRNKIRALSQGPGSWTYLRGRLLKIHKVEVEHLDVKSAPGEISRIESDSFFIATGAGELKVLEVQLEGKPRRNVREFLLGQRLQVGELLGTKK